MGEKLSQRESISFGRKLLFSVIVFICFILLFEGGMRMFYLARNEAFPRARGYSEKYGWTTGAHLELVNTFEIYGKVNYSTAQYGFRSFGAVDTPGAKIFAIGDSQTQARKVSDGEAYYHYVGRRTDSEVFAYGGGGYGTLQEYMILDEFMDLIEPSIILWQFCSNDIHNNSWALESRSWENNNHMVRPYYEDGEIRYRFPHGSWFYRNILRYSYVVNLLDVRLDMLLADNLGPIPSEMLSEDHPLFREAVDTTAEIMKLVKNRAGGIPVVAFSACGRPNSIQVKEFSNICHDLGIFYIKNVTAAIREAKASGVIVNGQPYDAHWNNNAHAIAGEIIANYLIDKQLLDGKGTAESSSW